MVWLYIVLSLFSDSGYLFSGSRPASQYKDSPSSGIKTLHSTFYLKFPTLSEHLIDIFCCFFSVTDYFSLISGSRPSSPGPSPTPSVAGSVASSSGSARHRRPLISPARLNISGRKLRLFSTEPEPTLMSPSVSSSYYHAKSASSVYSGCFSPDVSPFQSQNGEYSWGWTVKSEMFTVWGFAVCKCHSCYYHQMADILIILHIVDLQRSLHL